MNYRQRCISYGNGSVCRSVPASEAARGWSVMSDVERESAFRRGDLPYRYDETMKDRQSAVHIIAQRGMRR